MDINEKLKELTQLVELKLERSGINIEEPEYVLSEAEKLLQEIDEKRLKGLRKNMRKKGKRINMRICEEDLLALKERAAQERIPYQTLVARLINKYVSGELFMKGI